MLESDRKRCKSDESKDGDDGQTQTVQQVQNVARVDRVSSAFLQTASQVKEGKMNCVNQLTPFITVMITFNTVTGGTVVAPFMDKYYVLELYTII